MGDKTETTAGLTIEIDKTQYKKSIRFSKKELRIRAYNLSFTLMKNENNNFFSQIKKSFEQERYLNLHNFTSRNP